MMRQEWCLSTSLANALKVGIEDGSIDEVELLISFKFTDNNKEYMIYTKNETDENGNVTIYVASINREQGEEPKLGGVESEEEWTRIKGVLKELSKNVD